jgi:hypothetical protein
MGEALVTSFSRQIRETISAKAPPEFSDDEVKRRKAKLMTIVDKSLDSYLGRLESGKVKMTSSMDLERLGKLMLLLSGEPDMRIDNTSRKTETVEITTQLGVTKEELEDMMEGGMTLKELTQQIFMRQNEINDINEKK